MTDAAIETPVISANDRISFTFFLAIIFHAIVILGIGFSQSLALNQSSNSLDIILLNNADESPKDIDKADYISNFSQEGGGESTEKHRPTSPFTAFEQSNNNGIAPIPIEASAKQKEKIEQKEIITTSAITKETDSTSEKETDSKEIKNQKDTEFDKTLQMAKLSQEISDDLDTLAKRPKKRFISARTKTNLTAEYMFHWIKKVERLGNLNYPEKVRKKNLSGNLVLVTAINKDGTLHDSYVLKSSGSRLLDSAALDIVKKASPFAPFNEELTKTVDILYITRTWLFKSNTIFSQ